MPKAALLLVDVQNDFCPGGALPVPQGDEIVPALNRYIRRFADVRLPIYASRDWHLERTKHFAAYGGTWPAHCIQDTVGAAFHPDLALPEGVLIISKGMNPEEDSYSCFEGASEDGRNFLDVLKADDVGELYIGGLATDYCVKETVLDARRQGVTVWVLADAIRGVDVHAGDAENAVREMEFAGARFVTFETLPSDFRPSSPRRKR